MNVEPTEEFQAIDARGRFDECAWRNICARIAVAASKDCRQFFDQYVKVFSAGVDAQLKSLPSEFHPAALKIAAQWDYAKTPNDIAKGISEHNRAVMERIRALGPSVSVDNYQSARTD
ncbi:hypothetical protein AVMA1855_22475 [Acidovorax sp. SUPP1855]|uniref:hypothetical protein n=1 Tax=Acidovorax sp. SUPP1855 TaxID=431774 RepID=UPI0023DE3951|nr:hypothetical protein [Acidovorax sp. SUPP1855]GKS86969.1 hypothetical protein AVMA1855_22475 [Acidovorax sp. SUPP1855]